MDRQVDVAGKYAIGLAQSGADVGYLDADILWTKRHSNLYGLREA